MATRALVGKFGSSRFGAVLTLGLILDGAAPRIDKKNAESLAEALR